MTCGTPVKSYLLSCYVRETKKCTITVDLLALAKSGFYYYTYMNRNLFANIYKGAGFLSSVVIV